MLNSVKRPSLHVVKEGAGPVVVLSHALGCSMSMWDEVATVLKTHFTVVRYDHRNHGQSGFTDEPFSIDDMADDAAQLIQSLDKSESDSESRIAPVYFVGLSLGGMVAQSLAARYPHLVKACVIANSASFYDEAAKKMWADRMTKVQIEGVSAISAMAISRWFTPSYLQSDNQTTKNKLAAIKRELDALDGAAYTQSCAAVAGVDCRQSNVNILVPTLVLFGTQDLATPPELSTAIHRSIAGSVLAGIDAAHLSAVEVPLKFAEIVLQFLKKQEDCCS